MIGWRISAESFRIVHRDQNRHGLEFTNTNPTETLNPAVPAGWVPELIEFARPWPITIGPAAARMRRRFRPSGWDG